MHLSTVLLADDISLLRSGQEEICDPAFDGMLLYLLRKRILGERIDFHYLFCYIPQKYFLSD
jgi:hypothetical protein